MEAKFDLLMNRVLEEDSSFLIDSWRFQFYTLEQLHDREQCG